MKFDDVAAVVNFDESKFLGFEWVQIPRVLSENNTGLIWFSQLHSAPGQEYDRARRVIKQCRFG